MTEKLGGIVLLTVSLIIIMMIGSDIVYDVGLLKVLIFTMGMYLAANQNLKSVRKR